MPPRQESYSIINNDTETFSETFPPQFQQYQETHYPEVGYNYPLPPSFEDGSSSILHPNQNPLFRDEFLGNYAESEFQEPLGEERQIYPQTNDAMQEQDWTIDIEESDSELNNKNGKKYSKSTEKRLRTFENMAKDDPNLYQKWADKREQTIAEKMIADPDGYAEKLIENRREKGKKISETKKRNRANPDFAKRNSQNRRDAAILRWKKVKERNAADPEAAEKHKARFREMGSLGVKSLNAKIASDPNRAKSISEMRSKIGKKTQESIRKKREEDPYFDLERHTMLSNAGKYGSKVRHGQSS